MKKMNQCEGNCEEHKGEVVLVSVWDKNITPNKDWGHFWYCESAIEADKENGMTIYTIPDMPEIY